MKTLLLLLFSLFIALSSCRHISNQLSNNGPEQDIDSADTTPKATTILWIDKQKNVYSKQKRSPQLVRTVKAKVDIKKTGRVELLSYVKPQDSNVHQYLLDRLKIFRVTKIMLDSGFIKIGEQYVQLRYNPNKIRK